MKTRIFTSSSRDHEIHNGEVELLEALTEKSADIEDVGPMFKCKSEHGEFDAFEDELSFVE